MKIVKPYLILCFLLAFVSETYAQIIVNSYSNSSTVDHRVTSSYIEFPQNGGSVIVNGTADVDLKAGTYIHLGSGFHAGNFSAGGIFKAHVVQSLTYVVALFPAPYNGSVGKFEKLEIGVKLPSVLNDRINSFLNNANTIDEINPFDFTKIDVQATFVSPSNQTKVISGFFYKEYTRNFNSTNILCSNWDENYSNQYNWRVRFAPDEIGTWNIQEVKIMLNGSLHTLYNGFTFECVESNNPGFLEVGQHKNQLRYSGTQGSCFLIGENTAWTDTDPASGRLLPENNALHEDLWEQLAENGANTVSLGLLAEKLDFEWEELGNYATNLNINTVNSNPNNLCDARNRFANAWEIDQLFNKAHDLGLYIKFWLLDHPRFIDYQTRPNSYAWDVNPYNIEISGVVNPVDFFTNPTSKALFKRKLHYIIARWGYSTSIAWYEMFSETQTSWGLDFDSWYNEMSNFIKSNDPNHLVSASYGTPNPHAAYMSSVDITQTHNYNDARNANCGGQGSNPGSRWDQVQQLLTLYQTKPCIIGEIGRGFPSIDLCDPVSFHDAIWSSAMMGTMGTGLHWFLEIKTPLYHKQYKSVHNFFADIDFEANEFEPQKWLNSDNFQCGNGVVTLENFAQVSSDKMRGFGWVHNATYYWYNIDNSCGPAPSDDDCYTAPFNLPINSQNNKIEIKNLKIAKKYDVTWFKTFDEGDFHSADNDKLTNIFGRLKPHIPNMSGINQDFSYKIVRSGSTFRTMEDTLHITILAADTLLCPMDTFLVDGVYEDDFDGTLYTYNWDLGNGQTSNIAHPLVYYNSPGTYTVILVVTDELGYQDTLVQDIVVPDCNGNDSNNTRFGYTSHWDMVNNSNLHGELEQSLIGKDKNTVSIYPNPNTGKFTLSYNNSTHEDYTITIVDAFGHSVYNRTSSIQNQEIDLSTQAPGIYFVTIQNQNDVQVKKIIIE